MRIKKILSLKNMGIFSEFSWDSQNCDDFERYNFIYGWNYSGKTSLSRLFRCLETKQLHPDYPDLQFKIETDNGNFTHNDLQSNTDLTVRVFNEEFVEENFRWNDTNHRINPVLILGKKSIELEERLIKLEDKRQKLEKEKEKIESERNDLEKKLDDSLSQKATQIRSDLKITNAKEFDKNVLRETIEKIGENYKPLILAECDFQKKLDTFRSRRTYEPLTEIKIDIGLNARIERVNTILSRRITAQQIIPKLRDNPALNKWVRDGIDLHKDETKCQFCGNDLPSDLFERLNKHFSKEYDNLIREISELEKDIEQYKRSFEKIKLPDKARFYEEMQNNYDKTRQSLEESIESFAKEIDKLLKKLNEKKEKPFEILEPLREVNIEKELYDKLIELNRIIRDNNEKIEGVEGEKGKIKNELINHYVASAIDELAYFIRKKDINEKKQEAEKKEKELHDTIQEIKNIESQIKQTNVGSEKINTYLREFFPDDQLRLQTLEDGTYQIFRNDTFAKNLSAGEKNIISLIYFISKLEENNFNINESIIFIDDPVSSLDSNHFHRMYSLIIAKVLNCKQLFITTHNFEFFNLLKDLDDKCRNEKNFYMIKRVCKEQICALIENLPKVLRKHKSEYNYLFSLIKTFNESNFELLYIIPNVVRRFLESYLFLQYPDGKRFNEKLEKFLKDCELYKKMIISKIINEYSHEQNPEHALKFPDINEIKICIDTILTLLEKNDKEHYDALCVSLE